MKDLAPRIRCFHSYQSGKDYEASRRLFAELGFEERWESDGYAGFRNGGAEFILQRFDDEHFCAELHGAA